MASVVRDQEIDVLFLQEASWARVPSKEQHAGGSVYSVLELARRSGLMHASVGCPSHYLGNAILSRFPLRSHGWTKVESPFTGEPRFLVLSAIQMPPTSAAPDENRLVLAACLHVDHMSEEARLDQWAQARDCLSRLSALVAADEDDDEEGADGSRSLDHHSAELRLPDPSWTRDSAGKSVPLPRRAPLLPMVLCADLNATSAQDHPESLWSAINQLRVKNGLAPGSARLLRLALGTPAEHMRRSVTPSPAGRPAMAAVDDAASAARPGDSPDAAAARREDDASLLADDDDDDDDDARAAASRCGDGFHDTAYDAWAGLCAPHRSWQSLLHACQHGRESVRRIMCDLLATTGDMDTDLAVATPDSEGPTSAADRAWLATITSGMWRNPAETGASSGPSAASYGAGRMLRRVWLAPKPAADSTPLSMDGGEGAVWRRWWVPGPALTSTCRVGTRIDYVLTHAGAGAAESGWLRREVPKLLLSAAVAAKGSGRRSSLFDDRDSDDEHRMTSATSPATASASASAEGAGDAMVASFRRRAVEDPEALADRMARELISACSDRPTRFVHLRTVAGGHRVVPVKCSDHDLVLCDLEA